MKNEITEEAILEAKSNPNGWVYKIDGNFDKQDYVPPEAVVGAWKVDGNGKITGGFIPNPNYVSGAK